MEALDKRVVELLDAFEARNDLGLEAFKRSWRRAQFGEVHHIVTAALLHGRAAAAGAVLATRRRLLRALFATLLRLMVLPGTPLTHRVGAVYCLWAAHGTQTLMPPERIDIAPNALQAALAACREAREHHRKVGQIGSIKDNVQQDYDMVLSTMILDGSFQYRITQWWLEEMKELKRKERTLLPVLEPGVLAPAQRFVNLDLDTLGLASEQEVRVLRQLQQKHQRMMASLESSQRSWFDIPVPTAEQVGDMEDTSCEQFEALEANAKRAPQWKPRRGPRYLLPRHGLVLLGATKAVKPKQEKPAEITGSLTSKSKGKDKQKTKQQADSSDLSSEFDSGSGPDSGSDSDSDANNDEAEAFAASLLMRNIATRDSQEDEDLADVNPVLVLNELQQAETAWRKALESLKRKRETKSASDQPQDEIFDILKDFAPKSAKRREHAAREEPKNAHDDGAFMDQISKLINR